MDPLLDKKSSDDDLFGFSSSSQNNDSQSNSYEQNYSSDMTRDLLKSEYESDKEYILKAISDAIKDQDYVTAKDFVKKYESVAQDDVRFMEFAKMANQISQSHDDILRLETRLSVIPNTHYRDRYEILKQLVEKDPYNENYQNELNRCKTHLPAEKHESSQVEKNGKFMSTAGWIGSIWYFLIIFAFLYAFLTKFEIFSLLLVIISVGAIYLLSNHKYNPMRNVQMVPRVISTFFIWLFVSVVAFSAFSDDKSETTPENEVTVEAEPPADTANTIPPEVKLPSEN